MYALSLRYKSEIESDSERREGEGRSSGYMDRGQLEWCRQSVYFFSAAEL